MSIEVAAEALAETVEGFDTVYLLTVGDRPRPHVGAVSATVADGVVRVTGVGRTGVRDVTDHPAVTLLWPPPESGGYSLIVDGTATIAGDRVEVIAQRAMLHRPAPSPRSTDGSCASDCVELSVTSGTAG